jgi:hypothetical protein
MRPSVRFCELQLHWPKQGELKATLLLMVKVATAS